MCIHINLLLIYFKEMDAYMIKKLAWNTFKNTGNIDTFMELKQFIDLEENMKAENIYETIENKGSNNSRKNSSRF